MSCVWLYGWSHETGQIVFKIVRFLDSLMNFFTLSSVNISFILITSPLYMISMFFTWLFSTSPSFPFSSSLPDKLLLSDTDSDSDCSWKIRQQLITLWEITNYLTEKLSIYIELSPLIMFFSRYEQFLEFIFLFSATILQLVMSSFIQGWSRLENKIAEIIYTLFQNGHFWPILTVSRNFW